MWKECYCFATTVSVAHLFWARSEGKYFHILCPWILLAPEKVQQEVFLQDGKRIDRIK